MKRRFFVNAGLGFSSASLGFLTADLTTSIRKPDPPPPAPKKPEVQTAPAEPAPVQLILYGEDGLELDSKIHDWYTRQPVLFEEFNGRLHSLPVTYSFDKDYGHVIISAVGYCLVNLTTKKLPLSCGAIAAFKGNTMTMVNDLTLETG